MLSRAACEKIAVGLLNKICTVCTHLHLVFIGWAIALRGRDFRSLEFEGGTAFSALGNANPPPPHTPNPQAMLVSGVDVTCGRTRSAACGTVNLYFFADMFSSYFCMLSLPCLLPVEVYLCCFTLCYIVTFAMLV